MYTALAPDATLTDGVIDTFMNAAQSWGPAIQAEATFIFWVMVAIAFVLKVGYKIFKAGGADWGDFFESFTGIIITTGFWWWLIQGGFAMFAAIINGQIQLAGMASGNSFDPTAIVSDAFTLVKLAGGQIAFKNPETIATFLVSIVVFIIELALVAEFVKIKCKSWVVLYLGFLNLGLAGLEFTRDIAVNYVRKIWCISLELMTIMVLCAIGQQIIEANMAKLPTGAIATITDVLVMLASVFILYVLAKSLPSEVASIGGSGGSAGTGDTFGSVMAAAAAGVAAGAAALGFGSNAGQAAKEQAGDIKAIKDAVQSIAGSSGGGTTQDTPEERARSQAVINSLAAAEADAQKINDAMYK